LKQLHDNAIRKQKKTLAKEKEKEQGNVQPRQIAPKLMIMVNFEGIPTIPS
jgi:hypothetical protein